MARTPSTQPKPADSAEVHRAASAVDHAGRARVSLVALEKGRTEGIQEGHREGRREGEVNGLDEGIELALELKFGADGLALMPLVREVQRLDLLRTIRQTLRTAETLESVRILLR